MLNCLVVLIVAESPNWYTLPEWWLCILGVPTLLFIGWQALETRRAANASRRQSEIASDTAKKQLRAYLCIAEACVKFTDNGHLEGQLHIKNGGQTPAYNVETWCHASIREYPQKEAVPPPPDGLPMAMGVISAQEKQIMVANKTKTSPQILEFLKTPKVAYYIQGEVHYLDVFGDQHCLKYRLFYGGPAGTRTAKDSNGVEVGFLVMDSEGNTEE